MICCSTTVINVSDNILNNEVELVSNKSYTMNSEFISNDFLGDDILKNTKKMESELFPDPAFFAEIRTLVTVINEETVSQIKTLFIDNKTINSLEGIELLTGLEEITLQRSIIPNIELNRLSNLKNIKKMNVYLVSNFEDISPISNLTSLESLSWTGNTKIMPGFKGVYYNYDISSLKGKLPNLKYLAIGSSGVHGLDDTLPTFTMLEEVHLYRTQINNVESLANLKNLKVVDIRENRITDISPIKFVIENNNGQIDASKQLVPYMGINAISVFLDYNSTFEFPINIYNLDNEIIKNINSFSVPNGKLSEDNIRWEKMTTNDIKKTVLLDLLVDEIIYFNGVVYSFEADNITSNIKFNGRVMQEIIPKEISDATFTSLPAININVGQVYDLLKDVVAKDFDAENIIDKVSYTIKQDGNRVNNNTKNLSVGIYDVIYSVKGKNNVEITFRTVLNILEKQVNARLIIGDNITINLGEKVDLFMNVEAYDYDNTNLSDQIRYSVGDEFIGSNDLSIGTEILSIGEHTITYFVTGTNGDEVSMSKKLIVVDNIVN